MGAAREGERRPSYLKEAKACLLRNLETWLDRPAASISIAEAGEDLDRVKRDKSAVAANRTLAYGRAAYSWAVRRMQLEANPLKGIERPGREMSRERVLSHAEIGAIWKACDALRLVHNGFVRVLLLTLGRRDEVASMQWSELDDPVAPATWTLPRNRAKNGRAHVVHLSAPARASIAAQPRIEGNPHVFAGRAGGPVAAFSYAKDLLIAELKKNGHDLGNWRFHDFRRAGVTHLADRGVPPHVADRLLNYVTGSIQGVAAVYQRAEFSAERKAALDTWARLILAAADGRTLKDNVMPLQKAG